MEHQKCWWCNCEGDSATRSPSESGGKSRGSHFSEALDHFSVMLSPYWSQLLPWSCCCCSAFAEYSPLPAVCRDPSLIAYWLLQLFDLIREVLIVRSSDFAASDSVPDSEESDELSGCVSWSWVLIRLGAV